MVVGFLSHPLVLAAVVVIAVGIVAYEIISDREERRQPVRARGRPRSPSPPRSPPRSSPPSSSGNVKRVKEDANNIRNRKPNSDVTNKEVKASPSKSRNNTSDGDSVFSQNDLNVQPSETKLLNTSDQRHCKTSNLNVEGSSSDFVESDYKESVCEKIQKDLNIGQSLCKACGIETADAVCEPCGHRYMCAECAGSLFLIFGKCTICDADILFVSQ